MKYVIPFIITLASLSVFANDCDSTAKNSGKAIAAITQRVAWSRIKSEIQSVREIDPETAETSYLVVTENKKNNVVSRYNIVTRGNCAVLSVVLLP